MTEKKYSTIKEVVFDVIHKTQGNVIYKNLEEKVLGHFPDSAFKKTHWSWYRNQCAKGKYSQEFTDFEKENLRQLQNARMRTQNQTQNKTKNISQNVRSPEINAIQIDTNILDIVNNIIESALAYEKMTDNARKIGITGEVGEILACYHLGLRLCIDPRAAGYDAIDSEGKKVQIKTRRSETEGLPSDVGRIGTFSTHQFDYALLVLLDREYHVAEIWKADYTDVQPIIEKQKRRNPNLSIFKKVSQRIWRK
jgi:hypothetical protein